MASIVGRTSMRALCAPLRQPIRRRYATGVTAGEGAAEEQKAGQSALQKGAKRDPELYILLAIMSGAFGLAGWHFSRNPTSSSSENPVSKADGSEPWKDDSHGAAYQYHPGGDTSKARKDAPSALNEVIIPNVNLPKSLHEKYNKWGKEGY